MAEKRTSPGTAPSRNEFELWGLGDEPSAAGASNDAGEFSQWGLTSGDIEPAPARESAPPRTWGQVAGDIGEGAMMGIDDVLGTIYRGGIRGVGRGAELLGNSPDKFNRAAARDELISGLLNNQFEREHGSGWGQAGRVGGQMIATAPAAMALGPVAGMGVRAVAGGRAAQFLAGAGGMPRVTQLPTGALAQQGGNAIARLLSLASRGAGEGALFGTLVSGAPRPDATAVDPMSRSEMLDAPIEPGFGEQVAMGAGLGAVGSPVGSVIAKAAGSGLKATLGGIADQESARLARLARERFGIDIEPGQYAQNPMVRYMNDVANKMPFSGGSGAMAEQRSAFNRALANTFGENTDKLTVETINNARTRLGNQFDQNIRQMGGIGGDQQMIDEFDNLIDEAGMELTPDQVTPIRKQVANIIGKFTTSDPKSLQPKLTADAYKALTDYNSPLGRAMRSNDSSVRYYAGEIRDVLMGAAERTATDPDAVKALQATRGQWRNMLRVDQAADANGNVSVAKLANNLKSKGELGKAGDLSDLALIGTRFMRPLPESGTAERLAGQRVLGALGQYVGPALGVGGMGGVAAAGATGALGPIATAGGIVGVPLAARAVRTAINNPVTRALMERKTATDLPEVFQELLKRGGDIGALTAPAVGSAVQGAPRLPLQIDVFGESTKAPGFVDVRTGRYIPNMK
ncbi:hypothetical protein GGR25_002282 [Kaistia hirudinis]|uniref:Uncharacterized protein n=1 Tax=Kaistia hirudinis TaxID=1293440 RepID=A0A840ANM8_9HYPH|nr:hypothetical protein [Kaistia hirudinis]MBB3931232.1 hypothetical protein [Kaistia hirudinis]